MSSATVGRKPRCSPEVMVRFVSSNHCQLNFRCSTHTSNSQSRLYCQQPQTRAHLDSGLVSWILRNMSRFLLRFLHGAAVLVLCKVRCVSAYPKGTCRNRKPTWMQLFASLEKCREPGLSGCVPAAQARGSFHGRVGRASVYHQASERKTRNWTLKEMDRRLYWAPAHIVRGSSEGNYSSRIGGGRGTGRGTRGAVRISA